jgi:hypothetical protein
MLCSLHQTSFSRFLKVSRQKIDSTLYYGIVGAGLRRVWTLSGLPRAPKPPLAPSFVRLNPRQQCRRESTSTSFASSAASLWQRLRSFAIGAGLTALLTQFYVLEQLHRANEVMLLQQEQLRRRVEALEKNQPGDRKSK